MMEMIKHETADVIFEQEKYQKMEFVKVYLL